MKVIFVELIDDDFALYQGAEKGEFGYPYFIKDALGYFVECNEEGHPIKDAKIYKEVAPNEITKN